MASSTRYDNKAAIIVATKGSAVRFKRSEFEQAEALILRHRRGGRAVTVTFLEVVDGAGPCNEAERASVRRAETRKLEIVR